MSNNLYNLSLESYADVPFWDISFTKSLSTDLPCVAGNTTQSSVHW